MSSFRREFVRVACIVLVAMFAVVRPATAQMRIDVSGVGATQYPIAVATFASEGRVLQDIANVVRGDLARSGAFRLIDPQATLSDTASIDFIGLRSKGADSVLAGSVARLADGRYDVRFRLSDAVRQASLGGESILVGEADLRLAGHRIADWDGENVQSPLTSAEPIISTSWSPDGTRLAYVSFESKKPVVYVHVLATGQRIPVANFKGSNSAPGWSPDGRELAVALTRDGLSQVYVVPADGSGNSRRLTSSSGIDTEPVYSPDGKSIFFTSDRGGSPQIYRIPVNGGDPVRITFGSPYNVSPRISPDGRTLAFVTRRDGRFLVATKDLSGGAEQLISDGGREESPSFAPNGRWIMYATQSGGRDSLMAVSIDGRVKQRLTSNAGDIREPTWGPLPK